MTNKESDPTNVVDNLREIDEILKEDEVKIEEFDEKDEEDFQLEDPILSEEEEDEDEDEEDEEDEEEE